MRRSALLLLPVLCPGAAAAAEPFNGSIVSERPSFSTSPNVLPAGRFQVEGGVERRDAGVDATTLPLALLRYGLNGRVELQAGWAGLSLRDLPGGGDERVTNDVVVSAKLALDDGADGGAMFSLLTSLTLPTGDGRDAGDTTPAAALLWTRPVGARTSLFGQATVTLDRAFDDADLRASNAIGLSGAVTGRVGVFVEHFVETGEAVPTTHYLDVGVSYLLGDNLQLDAVLAFGLDDDADDGFFGGGVAYRW